MGAPIAYWAPGDDLARYVTGYHRYRAPMVPGGYRDAFFPSWAAIRISLNSDDDWSVRLGNRTFDPVPRDAFFGPSSSAGYITTYGGSVVGVGLKPLGWAQLFGGDIARYANRVVALDELDAGGSTLRAALEDGVAPPEALASWVAARLHRRPPADPRIETLTLLLDDPATTRIEALAEALDMTPRGLAALTRFNFGFTPKLLLRRTRFMRALSGVLTEPARGSEVLDAAGYWDRSHFLRDSHLFLGCSVRDFQRRRGPLNQMALTARQGALGSPV
ncbi:AraC family transcriptional regulator [Sphingomonas adhaesiva]|uniref:AraC family transcriptional regulator n=1 Tax=Sphingomonas adhaesiva TaxID=28212 RepID=UPI002FF7B0EA